MRTILGCLSVLLVGCTPTTSTTAPPRQVTVVGYGKVSAYPDEAEITVEVSFTKPKLKEAAAEVQAVITQVNGVVKPFVKTEQDLRTSTVSTNKAYNYRNNKEIFTGFQATQSLTVRLADLKRLEPFMEALLQTRISSIRHLSYSHTQADSLHREATLIAMRNSLKAADKLCAGLGQKRGAVLQVEEKVGEEASNGSWGTSQPVEMELYGKVIGGRSFRLTPELIEYAGAVQTVVALE
ncbi:SIMPL domain-containing protein [Hymenobacter wooponensis]|uniref:DUF541 domain-containing protein n=1 Tax=Hymenobacter wooponensis TaxID=1525360 RepID=A0A4Z0MU15_9BACT|nr:SIMPL domain-containing protein [Hymenobacter wooponensis]TGD83282.1 DUF541 domain-containing protein [Hymenobacter wooponensis]